MATGDVTIRPLVDADLDAADHVMRVAFGTFFVIQLLALGWDLLGRRELREAGAGR